MVDQLYLGARPQERPADQPRHELWLEAGWGPPPRTGTTGE